MARFGSELQAKTDPVVVGRGLDAVQHAVDVQMAGFLLRRLWFHSLSLYTSLARVITYSRIHHEEQVSINTRVLPEELGSNNIRAKTVSAGAKPNTAMRGQSRESTIKARRVTKRLFDLLLSFLSFLLSAGHHEMLDVCSC